MRARKLIKRGQKLFGISLKCGYSFVMEGKVKRGDFVYFQYNHNWEEANGIIDWKIENGKVSIHGDSTFYVVCRSL
jgi:hypothetical protein